MQKNQKTNILVSMVRNINQFPYEDKNTETKSVEIFENTINTKNNINELVGEFEKESLQVIDRLEKRLCDIEDNIITQSDLIKKMWATITTWWAYEDICHYIQQWEHGIQSKYSENAQKIQQTKQLRQWADLSQYWNETLHILEDEMNNRTQDILLQWYIDHTLQESKQHTDWTWSSQQSPWSVLMEQLSDSASQESIKNHMHMMLEREENYKKTQEIKVLLQQEKNKYRVLRRQRIYNQKDQIWWKKRQETTNIDRRETKGITQLSSNLLKWIKQQQSSINKAFDDAQKFEDRLPLHHIHTIAEEKTAQILVTYLTSQRQNHETIQAQYQENYDLIYKYIYLETLSQSIKDDPEIYNLIKNEDTDFKEFKIILDQFDTIQSSIKQVNSEKQKRKKHTYQWELANQLREKLDNETYISDSVRKFLEDEMPLLKVHNLPKKHLDEYISKMQTYLWETVSSWTHEKNDTTKTFTNLWERYKKQLQAKANQELNKTALCGHVIMKQALISNDKQSVSWNRRNNTFSMNIENLQIDNHTINFYNTALYWKTWTDNSVQIEWDQDAWKNKLTFPTIKWISAQAIQHKLQQHSFSFTELISIEPWDETAYFQNIYNEILDSIIQEQAQDLKNYQESVQRTILVNTTINLFEWNNNIEMNTYQKQEERQNFYQWLLSGNDLWVTLNTQMLYTMNKLLSSTKFTNFLRLTDTDPRTFLSDRWFVWENALKNPARTEQLWDILDKLIYDANHLTWEIRYMQLIRIAKTIQTDAKFLETKYTFHNPVWWSISIQHKND